MTEPIDKPVLLPCQCGSRDVDIYDYSDAHQNRIKIACRRCSASVLGSGMSTAMARAIVAWDARADPKSGVTWAAAVWVAGSLSSARALRDIMQKDGGRGGFPYRGTRTAQIDSGPSCPSLDTRGAPGTEPHPDAQPRAKDT